jgi:hypothetical protein
MIQPTEYHNEYTSQPKSISLASINDIYHHQKPPYGTLGDPYLLTKQSIKRTPSLTMSTIEYLEREKEYRDNIKTPCITLYLISHSISLIILSCVQIALQITLLSLNGALANVGAGIWAGIYFLITAILTLVFGKLYHNRYNTTKLNISIKFNSIFNNKAYTHEYILYVITFILHFIGILLSIGAYLIVNIIAIGQYVQPGTLPDDYIGYTFYNEKMKIVNYCMFFIGVICCLLCIVFCIIILW